MSYPPGNSGGYPPMGGPTPPPGYPYPPPQPPRSPWSSPLVLLAIAVGVVIVIGASVAAIVLTRDSTSADTASDQSQASTPSLTTVPQNQGTGAGTTGAPQTSPPQISTPPSRATPTVTGADWQGFLDGPRCNASDDPAVLVGQTPRSRVVICQVGAQTGRWYYKGQASGGSIEIGYPQRVGSSYVATNGSTSYTVSSSSLVITENGVVTATEPMVAFWSAP